MADYNAKLHVKTSTGYDNINVATKASIVTFDKSGTDLSSSDTNSVIKEINTKVNNKLEKSSVVNNLTTSDATKPLSASMGKQLNEKISSLFNVTSGKGTINNEVLDSSTSACDWVKSGNVCHVNFILKSKIDISEENLTFFSGLPKAIAQQNFSYHAINEDNNISRNGYLSINTDGTIHDFYYFKPKKGVDCKGGFTYICEP